MTNISIPVAEITDAVMAADAMAASLDRSDERLTIITDDHTAALTELIAQAAAIVIAECGDAVTAYTIDATTIAVTHHDNIVLAAPLRTAIVWRTLQLCYVGSNKARAQYSADIVRGALAVISGYSAPCPPNRLSHY